MGVAEDRAAHERRALHVSIATTAAVGGVGIVVGVLASSQMVMLDGVFAFVGVAVSWLLLQASHLAGREPTRRHPFGLEAATPVVIGIQGAVLLATLGLAAVDAVGTIVDGGSEVVAGWALAYAVLNLAVSATVWRWLGSSGRVSDIVTAEAAAWRIGALRGLGMTVGFGLIAVMADRADGAARYVDPVMVLVTCVAFLGGPLGMVRTMVAELLEAAPSETVQAPILGVVREVEARHGLPPSTVLMSKVGPKVYVEVTGRAGPGATVAEEHEVRCAIERGLDGSAYDVWLNLELLPAEAGG